MTLSAAVTSFVRSIYEAISGVLGLVYGLFRGVYMTVASLVQSIFGLLASIASSVVAVAGGLVGFVMGNIVVLAVIAVGVYLYMQQQGGRKTPSLTTNGGRAGVKGK